MSLRDYERFGRILQELTPADGYRRIESSGYMPLSVERIGPDHVAMSHAFVQNGDLMRDPEVVFCVMQHGGRTFYAEPVSFRSDPTGYCSEVYRYDDHGRRTHVRPRVKRDLRAFCVTWFRNLREQGFLDAARKAA